MITDLQKKFIKSEIYILAWNGSVQHNTIYKLDCSTNDRSQFKKDMILYLENYIIKKYFKRNSEEDHHNNIVILKEYAEKIGKNILLNKSYKIGTAQKFNCDEKLAYSACERAERDDLIEYGVSLRTGWLTDKGKELLIKENKK